MTKKQKQDYLEYLRLKSQGRLLTPDGIRFICQMYDYDPEKIGRHILECLPKVTEENK